MKNQRHKPKIAYLVNSFPGLSETFILNEMDVLENLGFDICCFSLSDNGASPIHRLAKKWISRAYWPPKLLSLRLWLLHLKIASRQPLKYFHCLTHYRDYGDKKHFLFSIYFANIMKKEGIKHIHAQFGFCAGAAMLIALLTDVGFSFTLYHSDILFVPPPNMPQLINHSRFCVTISQFNKNYLINHWSALDPGKIQVIRSGVDTERHMPNSKNHAHDKVLKLLTVARLDKIKNISLLIDICGCLRERGYEYVCIIVGEGPERLNLERKIHDLNLEDRVILKGAMSQEELIPVYQNADIFILTSRSEGIPVAAMEAMACELPFVAPEITGMQELVVDGQTGLLYPEGDLGRATDAVIKLIEDADLRIQIGIQGREKVIRDFNNQVNVSQLAGLFYELLAV